jgi:hypothetical protein
MTPVSLSLPTIRWSLLKLWADYGPIRCCVRGWAGMQGAWLRENLIVDIWQIAI